MVSAKTGKPSGILRQLYLRHGRGWQAWLVGELRSLGHPVSHQAVQNWCANKNRIAPGHVLALEKIVGVPRHELRPDIYPPPKKERFRSGREK